MRHMGFPVTDIDKSLRFYMDDLGFEFVCTGHITSEQAKKLLNKDFEFSYYKLSYPIANILELYYISSEHIRKSSENLHSASSLIHIALTVNNIQSYWDKFKGLGCCVSNELMTIDNHKLFFVKDPDGYIVELVEKVGFSEHTR